MHLTFKAAKFPVHELNMNETSEAAVEVPQLCVLLSPLGGKSTIFVSVGGIKFERSNA